MKKCTKCLIEKDLDQFGKKNGKLNSRCRPCIQEYWKQWYANPDNAKAHIKRVSVVNDKARARVLDLIKRRKDVPCADCGNRYNPWQMDFDHVRGKKLENVSKMSGFKLETVLAELEKCDVVCSNCHRDRTHFRNQNRSNPRKKKYD